MGKGGGERDGDKKQQLALAAWAVCTCLPALLTHLPGAPVQAGASQAAPGSKYFGAACGAAWGGTWNACSLSFLGFLVL